MVVQIRHVIYAVVGIVILFFIFSGYSYFRELEQVNRNLLDENTSLNVEMHDIRNQNIQLEEDLLKSNEQVRLYEDKYNRTLGKLNQLTKAYQDEKNNPTHSTTNERFNFIRTEIGK